MLSPEEIAEFKQLYKELFGVELSDKQAKIRAHNLLKLVEAINVESPNGERGNDQPRGYEH